MELDLHQREAVEHGGNSLVIAGPGSGKTLTLVERVRFLLEGGVPPERICLLTFTVKAASELKERLKRRGLSGPKVKTFHSMAYELLSEEEEVRLVDETEARELASWIKKKLSLRKSPELVLEHVRSKEGPERDLYLKVLKEKGAYDYFRIMLEVPQRVQRDFSGYHILVDECQDLSPDIRDFLSVFRGATFFLVGDPSQAIYGFRGANGVPLREFVETLPDLKVFYLRRSYRVSSRILKLAEGLRSGPFLVPLEATKDGGSVKGLSFSGEREEAVGIAKLVSEILGGTGLERAGQGLPPEEVMVLSRLRKLLEPLRETMAREGIPVEEPEEEARRKAEEVKRLGALLKTKSISFSEALAKLREVVPFLGDEDAEDETQLLLLLQLLGTGDLLEVRSKGVRLLTVHGAKGLEAEAVVLCGAQEGVLPLTVMDDCDLEEEKRILYVAVTRAKSAFYFTFSRKRILFGRRLSGRPTRWLEGLSVESSGRRARKPKQVGLFF